MTRPASTDPATARAPAASTRPATRTALAVSTADRRGIAVSVVRIMPVLYSPLIASTARMATTAWPDSIPVRLSLVVSTGHAVPDGHLTAAVAAALTATVSTTVPASSQAGPDTVRSLVHSACSVSRMLAASTRRTMDRPGGPACRAWLMRPSGGAGQRPGPG